MPEGFTNQLLRYLRGLGAGSIGRNVKNLVNLVGELHKQRPIQKPTDAMDMALDPVSRRTNVLSCSFTEDPFGSRRLL